MWQFLNPTRWWNIHTWYVWHANWLCEIIQRLFSRYRRKNRYLRGREFVASAEELYGGPLSIGASSVTETPSRQNSLKRPVRIFGVSVGCRVCSSFYFHMCCVPFILVWSVPDIADVFVSPYLMSYQRMSHVVHLEYWNN